MTLLLKFKYIHINKYYVLIAKNMRGDLLAEVSGRLLLIVIYTNIYNLKKYFIESTQVISYWLELRPFTKECLLFV